MDGSLSTEEQVSRIEHTVLLPGEQCSTHSCGLVVQWGRKGLPVRSSQQLRLRSLTGITSLFVISHLVLRLGKVAASLHQNRNDTLFVFFHTYTLH
jgi:hypothetical protein